MLSLRLTPAPVRCTCAPYRAPIGILCRLYCRAITLLRRGSQRGITRQYSLERIRSKEGPLARHTFDQTKHMAVQRMEAAACLAIAMLASEMRRAQGTDDRAIAHVEMALQKAVRRQSQLVRNLT